MPLPDKVSESFKRLNPGLFGLASGTPAPVVDLPDDPSKAPGALRQRHAPAMNKLEARFLVHLKEDVGIAERIHAQEIVFALSNGTTYRPDFVCFMLRFQADEKTIKSLGTIWEVKGGKSWEDSLIKLKWFAHEYPCFTVFFCREKEPRRRGEWWIQEILP